MNVCSPVKKKYSCQGTPMSLCVRTGGHSYSPYTIFTAILQHFYRTFMTRSSAPIYTLRGRTGTEAAPATEQGFPGADALAAHLLATTRRRRPLARSEVADVVPDRGGQPLPLATTQVFCSRFAAPTQVRRAHAWYASCVQKTPGRRWRSVIPVGLRPAGRASISCSPGRSLPGRV